MSQGSICKFILLMEQITAQKGFKKGFSLIVAVSRNGAIGFEGKLPWPYIPKEMKHFSETTQFIDTDQVGIPDAQNAVIMGRKTWESIPLQNKPLRNRLNVVLTSQVQQFKQIPKRLEIQKSLGEALTALDKNDNVREVFLIGGTQMFAEALTTYINSCKLLILTRINKDFVGDTFMPTYDSNNFQLIHQSKTFAFGDITYDYIYLGNKSLIKQIPTFLYQKYQASPEFQFMQYIKHGSTLSKTLQLDIDLTETFPIFHGVQLNDILPNIQLRFDQRGDTIREPEDYTKLLSHDGKSAKLTDRVLSISYSKAIKLEEIPQIIGSECLLIKMLAKGSKCKSIEKVQFKFESIIEGCENEKCVVENECQPWPIIEMKESKGAFQASDISLINYFP
ncbi:hypothetical protein FGO68_gene7406 [Halteria grandinella]|uniref:Bifunctional dihydrofolate reductase-thymidylate synthase n=1 Tax=Halteria grandinella TaxID=5974 RepID=A0A8J8NL70_HALGN|nr:hypothetical protein FGO68_gene7406 [Halteria grandinella]